MRKADKAKDITNFIIHVALSIATRSTYIEPETNSKYISQRASKNQYQEVHKRKVEERYK